MTKVQNKSFNKGDKVIVVDGGRGCIGHCLAIGTMATVTRDVCSENASDVTVEGVKEDTPGKTYQQILSFASVKACYKTGDTFTVIEAPDTAISHCFKVGDVVDFLSMETQYGQRKGVFVSVKNRLTQTLSLESLQLIVPAEPEPEEVIDVAAIDWSLPLETLAGVPVTLITTEGRNKHYPVMAYKGDSSSITHFTADGHVFDHTAESGNNLRNVVPKPLEIIRYVNIYVGGAVGNTLHATRADADVVAARRELADQKRIGVRKVMLVEGEYDE